MLNESCPKHVKVKGNPFIFFSSMLAKEDWASDFAALINRWVLT